MYDFRCLLSIPRFFQSRGRRSTAAVSLSGPENESFASRGHFRCVYMNTTWVNTAA